MKFTVKRSLEDKVFSTTIAFDSFGVVAATQSDEDDQVVSMSMTAEEEMAIFNDFGFPVIEVGGEFKGFVKISEGKVVLSEESDSDAKKIEFVRNVEKYTLDDTFKVKYSSNAKKLEDTDDFKALQISEAKCLIFEKAVEANIKAALDQVKEDRTAFEKENPAKQFSY